MKKLFLSVAFLATAFSFGQSIYVPGGFSASGIGFSSVAGNVGVGTAAPTEKLEVNGNIIGLDLISGGTNTWRFHTPDDTRTNLQIVPKVGVNFDWGKATIFSNNGDVSFSNSININNSVGIGTGTTTLTEKLQVEGNILGNDLISGTTSGVNKWIFHTPEDGRTSLYIAPRLTATTYDWTKSTLFSSNGDVQFSNSAFFVNSIGIGTSTPAEKIDVVGNSKISGKVTIGGNPFPTNSLYSTYKLFVKGGILTDEVRVALSTATGWADYVFAKDYNLKPLAEVEAFITKNKHLPNVPSAAQVKEEGINVGDMARIQQEKIEELTLYIIAQNKRIEALEAKMNTK